MVHATMGHGRMTRVVLARMLIGRSIVQGLWLKLIRLRLVEVLVVAHGWWYAIELQADARGARPCIRCRCITFDLASAATLACSHDY